MLGLVQSYSSIYLHFGSTDLSPYGVLAQFILVIAVLAVRPLGLFGRPA
jgi:branched-subunit amino acid ABC-type transport system permease component